MTKPAPSRRFVLVHVGHGAWCWFRLRLLLEADGREVTCLDLTSAGVHPSDADSVVSFEEYDKPLVDFMSSLPENEKVVLVGHSAGGLSLTHIMHEFPEKISVAIFIAATMLPSGFLSEQDMKDYSTLASMLLRPWPAQVFSSVSFREEEDVNKIRRVYIKTARDNMVKPEQQDAMIQRWPPSEVFVMDADHSPFFSAPEELCKLIFQASI
ncbi:methylesterase 17 isoform X2 [Asparagus officinalis]|uniref:methylesterase 17 isoform X2 n=1 Tax=Asparagus officinalis TaxID=4686 RepID=UPI00098E4310|nr:methylesterase 17 isoform X2 [Asparagus officinalis]